MIIHVKKSKIKTFNARSVNESLHVIAESGGTLNMPNLTFVGGNVRVDLQ